jgi:hypothetical protein
MISMRVRTLVIVGAALPLVVGAGLGSITTSSHPHTWSHPTEPTAFLLMSTGLAISHWLVMLGYLEVTRRTSGAASTLATLGAAGSAAIGACEVWSGLEARTSLDAPVLDALDTGYAISALLIVIGTIGCGFLLRRVESPLAMPLLVNGSFLLLATVIRFLASDGLGIAALTVWSLLYIWLGLRLGDPGRRSRDLRADGGSAGRTVGRGSFVRR